MTVLTITEARELTASLGHWPETPSCGARIVVVACRHHWVIEPANSNGHQHGQSKGRCLNCGECRMFSNAAGPTYYEQVPKEKRESLEESYEGLLARLQNLAELEMKALAE